MKSFLSMMLSVCSGATILTSEPKAEALTAITPIPSDGKFFYSDLRGGGDGTLFDIHETHRVDTLMSIDNQQLALGLNSEVGFFAVYSDACTMCDVSGGTKFANTSSTVVEGPNPLFDGYVFDPSDESLKSVQFLSEG